MMRSLRSRVVGGMGLLLGLVFVIALLGVSSIRALDESVSRELELLVESTDLGSGLVSSVASEIRSAEQYLVRQGSGLRLQVIEEGDSAYALQRRYRTLRSLTTSDRYIVNQIADNQAKIEVAYAMAHALTDLEPAGRGPPLRRPGPIPRPTPCCATCAHSRWRRPHGPSRAPSDLGRQADQRRQMLWLLFFISLLVGGSIVIWTVRMVDRPLTQLVGAAERFGAGDLRPLRLGAMPTELARLSRAMDDMGGRLRCVVVSVVGEASTIGTSASDFSAMSEELAASSGEISTAMVKIAGQRGTAGEGNGKGGRAAPQPAADRRGQRQGGGASR